MGCFKVSFGVGPVGREKPPIQVEGLLDTGAAFPFIPGDVLGALGIVPSGRRGFELADGSKRTFPVGEARFYYGKLSAPCLVAFAPKGAEPLLGALALESLALEVDPVNRRLRPVRVFFAAAA